MEPRKNLHVWPIYGPSGHLFTCEIYHGGTIYMDYKKVGYMGGKRDYFDYLDPDEMSLIELSTMVQKLGYSEKTRIWCRAKGNKNINPKLLRSDQELMEFINKLQKKHMVLECFLDHNEWKGCDGVKGANLETQNLEGNNLFADVNCSAIQGEILHGSSVNIGVEKSKASMELDESLNVVVGDEEGDLIKSIDQDGDCSEEDGDFYDPDNDIVADDNDLNFELNVTPEMMNKVMVSVQSIETEPIELEDSCYAPSDELLTGSESDDEVRNKRRYPEFNAAIDMANPYFEVGMIFGSFKEFKEVVIEYAIKARRNIRFEKNDTKRVKAACKKGCPWTIWVSRVGKETENVQVKTSNPSHMCVNEHNIKFLTVNWLVSKYLPTFRDDPTWSLAGLIHRVRNAWTFMSDRQKGLVPILKTLFPGAEHRFCVRHMYQNFFNAGHKGKILKNHLWMAATATHDADYMKWMCKLKKLSQPAHAWLESKPAKEWSKSQFSTRSKSDMLLNNLSECFNKYILDARDKPILTMLEMIRTKLMRILQVKRDEMKRYKGPICPKIKKKLDKWKDESVKYTAVWNGGTHYQVAGPSGQFVVNIAAASCSCRRWDITGIPCQHACASMRINGLMPENYVNDFYKVETFFKSYNHVIIPMSGQEQWEKCNFPKVMPPPIDPPKPGRPKKARRKNNEEIENNGGMKISKKGGKIVCSICHKEGHNKRKHNQGTNGVNVIQVQAQSVQQQMEVPTAGLKKLPVRRKRDSSCLEASNENTR